MRVRVPALVMATVVTTMMAGPADLYAQRMQTRDGFWFNLGLGWGSRGCEDCAGREGGFSGGPGLGGTLSQKVLLGASYNFWTNTENDITFTAGTLTAAIRFYPSSTGGFFLLGGLGVGTFDVEVEFLGGDARSTETGFGALLGLGYDIRVGRNVSLTPYWNGFAVSYDGGDANVSQLGLGVTIH